MKFKRHSISFLATALFASFLLSASMRAQDASPANAPVSKAAEAGPERLEIKFSQPQLLELELTRYLTTDVHKSRTFEVTATLADALRTEKGTIIIPAQTKIRLTVLARPGKRFGHEGEMVMWINPFLIGKGIDGFSCDAGARLLPQLCQETWRLSFNHQLDYAATPETGLPMYIVRKKGHEGLSGKRSTRPPNFAYDASSNNVDLRLQTAANRYQAAGIIYDVGAALTGAIRFFFSKRNLFLPSGSRLVFKLDDKLRLVPATESDVEVIRFDAPARKQKSRTKKSDDASGDKDDR
ncbi:MAG: hypothetical protein ACREEM_07545 [Blastocatellia bacterium]